MEVIGKTTNNVIIFIFAAAFLLGYLNPSSDSDTLEIGVKLDLPLWLAKGLCSQKRHLISIDLPKQFKESYRYVSLTCDAAFDVDATTCMNIWYGL